MCSSDLTVVISPPDGHMGDYLRSLDALHLEEIDYIAPGHGFLMGDPHAVINHILRHRRDRESKVLAALDRLGSAAEDRLLAAVYDDVPTAIHAVARRSLRAHLALLRDEGTVLQEGTEWRRAQ